MAEIASRGDAALDNKSFRVLADLAYREAGLVLSAGKLSLIQSRLRHRLRALQIQDFGAYAQYVSEESNIEERSLMISALTTNVSHFFREDHHFNLLRESYFPDLIKSARQGSPVRIWSAGCSNGQEPYSLAMTLLEMDSAIADCDLRILATDIDRKVLEFAQVGRYNEKWIEGVPQNLRNRFFKSFPDNDDITYEAKDQLKDLIRFRQLNLLKAWPMRGQFDIIMCRNVVIYFDAETQNKLWPRFHAALKNEGCLCLGHSERISDTEAMGFVLYGSNTYHLSSSKRAALQAG